MIVRTGDVGDPESLARDGFKGERFDAVVVALDDDGDGLVDCADGDCVVDDACAVSGCPDLSLGSFLGDPLVSGTTVGAGADVSSSCAGDLANDVTYIWQAPSNGRYLARVASGDYLPVISVRSGSCTGTELDCSANSATVEVTFEAQAGQLYVLVVDGVSPEICFNGLDDDQNGLFDCDDAACSFLPDCQIAVEICGDGFDNDFNGLADCQDPFCQGVPECFGVEVCFNGEDDDADGAIDCEDEECQNTPFCGPVRESCFNGFDDDGNGLTDCDDPFCVQTGQCEGRPEDCFNGFDDDANGLVDCEDPFCIETGQCEGRPEDCFNGFDDDAKTFLLPLAK